MSKAIVTKKACPKCHRRFKGERGLRVHLARAWHYEPPPPPEPIPQEHVPFAALAKAGTNWGKKMPRGKWANPTDNDLMLGYLARIADRLDDIHKEQQRTKIIR